MPGECKVNGSSRSKPKEGWKLADGDQRTIKKKWIKRRKCKMRRMNAISRLAESTAVSRTNEVILRQSIEATIKTMKKHEESCVWIDGKRTGNVLWFELSIESISTDCAWRKINISSTKNKTNKLAATCVLATQTTTNKSTIQEKKRI